MTDKYNDGYTHEALHTAHVLTDAWERHVVDTRCADEFPDVKEACNKAAAAMADVYQLIGTKFSANADLGPIGDARPDKATQ